MHRGQAFVFGPYPLHLSEIFCLTAHSLAIVNLKPILPGHCLVLPRRCVPRFAQLTDVERNDLWETVQRIGPALEKHFEATSLTIAIQDGKQAGQTVPHVHVHLIPRKQGDFEKNDQVYDELEKNDLRRERGVDADDNRKERTVQEMAEEAAILRTLFPYSLPIQ